MRVTSLIVPRGSGVSSRVPAGGVVESPGGQSPAPDIFELEKHQLCECIINIICN